MKLTDIWKTKKSPTISFELFPARSPKAAENLEKAIDRLASFCGATIVDEVRQGIAALPEGDKEALFYSGIEFALRQCRELLGTDIPGLHFYSMDRSKSAVGIVN
jgi:methylenetetrahydrofolate reductase (NADPH)